MNRQTTPPLLEGVQETHPRLTSVGHGSSGTANTGTARDLPALAQNSWLWVAGLARRHPLLIYFGLTFAISWAVWGGMMLWSIRPGLGPNFSMNAGYLVLLVGIAGPSIAALILTGAARGWRGQRQLLSKLTRWRVAVIWYVLAIGGPLLLALLAATLYTALGGQGLQVSGFSRWYVLIPQLLWGLVFGGPLEEELGWRGYALPRLQMRMHTLSAGLLLGVIWGLWHLPLYFLPGTTQYASVVGSPWAVAWYAEFVAETTALSVLLAWIYNNTRGSVLLTMLLHAAANTAYSLLAIIGLVTTWQVLLFFDAGLWLAVLVLSVAGLLTGRRRSALASKATRAHVG